MRHQSPQRPLDQSAATRTPRTSGSSHRAGQEQLAGALERVRPDRTEVKIEGIDLFAGRAALSEWENGLQQIEVVDLTTRARHRIDFASQSTRRVSDRTWSSRPRPALAYRSLVTPSSIFDYDMDAAATLEKQTEVPGGSIRRTRVRPADATAGGGTGIPDFDRLPQDVKKVARRRCAARLGSYRASLSPSFRPIAFRCSTAESSSPSRTFERRRDGRAMARRRPHDEEGEHVHRLHRGGRAPRSRRTTPRRTGW